MSTFITDNDYLLYQRQSTLDQIKGTNTLMFEAAESTALAVVKDALYPVYDTDAIFATTGTDRPPQVLRWAIVLVLYYIYERVPDAVLPERIENNYTEVIGILKDVSDGKMSVDLPRLEKEDGTPKTKFRWGSNPLRGHDIY